MVSIYILRKERDHLRSRKSTSTRYCNPRARKERDLTSAELYANTSTFQSTCSARSATNVYFRGSLFIKFQSTRSARSATRRHDAAALVNLISIHALRKECDSKSGHKRPLLRCIHNDYSPHMCFFLMFTPTNLIQLDF